MPKINVKIGFIPSYREFTEANTPVPAWVLKMRRDALAVFQHVPGLQIVAPRACPDDPARLDAEHGFTPDGVICNLDQAEAMAEFFQGEKVDGLIIGALNFGDERSAAKIAEKLRLPVLLYATKEPPVPAGPSMGRVSDSYCGTLSLASALYRRKLSFHFAGIVYAEEARFLAEVDKFVRAVAVVKALKGARIGQVGCPPTRPSRPWLMMRPL